MTDKDLLTPEERAAVDWLREYEHLVGSEFLVVLAALDRVAPKPRRREWRDCTVGEMVDAYHRGERVRSGKEGKVWQKNVNRMNVFVDLCYVDDGWQREVEV